MTILTLQETSPTVFDLDEYEYRILKYLALSGPMNLTQISKQTKRYADSLDRWGIQKRLYGTARFIGLIRNEYVLEENVNKHRFNKQEKRYWLSVKGILASTAIVPLQKNKFFKHYCWFITKIVQEPKLHHFVEEFIEEHMRLLIAWHYLNGIQLTKQRSSAHYYLEFFEQIKTIGVIDVTTSDRFVDNEFMHLVKKCIKLYTVLDLLSDGGLDAYRPMQSIIDWEKTKSVSDASKYHGYAKIWEWPLYLGNPEFHSPGYSLNISKIATIRNEIQLEEVYSNDMKQEVDEMLEKIDHEQHWESVI